MRLIWSALWGAYPGEIHLISEFLIPSLRARALAPGAAPQEVGGGRQAQATGEGRGWDAPAAAQGPRQAPRGPAAFLNSLRPGSWALGQRPAGRGRQPVPLPFLVRAESVGTGNGRPVKEKRSVHERNQCEREQRRGLHRHFTILHNLPRKVLKSLGRVSHAWLRYTRGGMRIPDHTSGTPAPKQSRRGSATEPG